MVSFDVESLFSNIPFQETIDLSVGLLFNDKHSIDGFTVTVFHKLLTVTIFESLVLFDDEYYKEVDRVAIGSPLGPTFTNIFVSYLEQIWLKNVLVNLNLSFTKDMLMTLSCYFDQRSY